MTKRGKEEERRQISEGGGGGRERGAGRETEREGGR